MRPPTGYANTIRAIVNAFLDERPRATFDEVCNHLVDRRYIVADREMLRGFLNWQGK